jgi:uncharacterized protein YdeI (YjbR/CyaY-like superfamily)
MREMSASFFESAGEFRAWLQVNHQRVPELWVGFHKRDSGKAGITYGEALDEALCFGWIDGVRQRVNAHSYRIRFTPRRARSTWSLVNTKRARQLQRQGRMHAAGLIALRARDPRRSGIYSFESAARKLDEAYEVQLRKNEKAWAFFQTQPPWYRRTSSFWVMSAKKEETRTKRLAILLRDSARGQRIGPLRRQPK